MESYEHFSSALVCSLHRHVGECTGCQLYKYISSATVVGPSAAHPPIVWKLAPGYQATARKTDKYSDLSRPVDVAHQSISGRNRRAFAVERQSGDGISARTSVPTTFVGRDQALLPPVTRSTCVFTHYLRNCHFLHTVRLRWPRPVVAITIHPDGSNRSATEPLSYRLAISKLVEEAISRHPQMVAIAEAVRCI